VSRVAPFICYLCAGVILGLYRSELLQEEV
jgi:hypothetical protein